MVDVTTILHLIPPYLNDVEDYLALTSTNRVTRSITCENTSPHTLLGQCYQSRRTFFRPDTLFLLCALARPLSLWARKSEDNLRRLVHSFWSGEEAVLLLAISVPAIAIEAKWSIAKVRELWEWRMRVINPLEDLIDKCVGGQWYNIPNFWDGGAEDAATLDAEPNETIFRMIIYGELFGDGWDQWMEATQRLPKSFEQRVAPFASIPIRLEYVKYLLPDWHTPPAATEGTGGINRGLDMECSRPYHPGEIATPGHKVVHETTGHTRNVHPLRAVQRDVGPYTKRLDSEFQSVLIHLLTASVLWSRVTAKLRNLCGGEFKAPLMHFWLEGDGDLRWRQDLWENALYLLGNEGMEMVIQVWKVVEADNGDEVEQRGPGWHKLRRCREVIASLEVEPEKVHIGARWMYEVPHFLRDMSVAVWDRY